MGGLWHQNQDSKILSIALKMCISSSSYEPKCRKVDSFWPFYWTVSSLQTCLHRACWPWASFYLVVYHIYHWITFVYYSSFFIIGRTWVHSWILCQPEASPTTGLWPSAMGSPFWGSGQCLTGNGHLEEPQIGTTRGYYIVMIHPFVTMMSPLSYSCDHDIIA